MLACCAACGRLRARGAVRAAARRRARLRPACCVARRRGRRAGAGGRAGCGGAPAAARRRGAGAGAPPRGACARAAGARCGPPARGARARARGARAPRGPARRADGRPCPRAPGYRARRLRHWGFLARGGANAAPTAQETPGKRSMSQFRLRFPRAYRLKPVGQRAEDALSLIGIGSRNKSILVPYSPNLEYVVAPRGDGALPIECARLSC